MRNASEQSEESEEKSSRLDSKISVKAENSKCEKENDIKSCE